MRVVVTGGAGFIGANLVKELCAAGDEVIVIDDLSSGIRSNLEGLDADLRVGSILDPELLDSTFTGADAVVHLAAIPSVALSVSHPLASNEANVTGTIKVLEAARRAGNVHVTVASSSAVYGSNPELPKHEAMRCDPVSPYGVSKLAAEAYALAFSQCYELPTLAFRFFNVFGPLQPAGHAYAAVIPAFVDAAIAGRPLPLEGDGSQTRDFIYVGTVVKVLAEAARRRVVSRTPVNLALGGKISLRQLIEIIESELGNKVVIESKPPRPGDVPHSQGDSTMLEELFPNIEAVPVEQGLADTVAWFRETATA